MSRKISIKYGKDQHQVFLDPDETLESLQGKIYWATTVLAKNMRILNKGMKIQDDKSVQSIKEGSVLTIMGAKESDIMQKIEIAHEAPKALKETEKEVINYGLINIKNTCYLNAAVQFLKGSRELAKYLKNFPVPPDNYGFKGFTSDLAQVIRGLEKDTVKPIKLVANFLEMAPTFQPLGEQQDAEECLNQKFLNFLGKVCTIKDKVKDKDVNLIEYLFEIEYFDSVSTTQVPGEKPKENLTNLLKLSCIIGGNPDVKINNINAGIKAYLNDTVMKKSDTDGNEHLYTRSSRISKLPRYLIIHEVRFFWKEANELGGTKATGTKITRAIEFPQLLDLQEFCTDELKEKLTKGRDLSEKLKKKGDIEEDVLFKEYLSTCSKQRFKDEKSAYRDFKEVSQVREAKKFDEDLYRQFDTGHTTGEYNLVGAITHLGHSIFSGHYMAWVHKSGKWWDKFDDDTVLEKKIEDVLGLRGGLANTQMAYVLLYRRREVPDDV